MAEQEQSLRVLQDRYAKGLDLTQPEIERVKKGDRFDTLDQERRRQITLNETRALVEQVRDRIATGRPIHPDECGEYQLRLLLALVAGMIAHEDQ